MKKYVALALVLVLSATLAFALTSCNNEDTPDPVDTSTTIKEPVETSAPETKKPQEEGFYGYTTLTLTKDPVIDSEGRLVLYFNENILCTETTKAYIGMKTYGAADSILSTPDMKAYPDMFDGNSCHGVALVPEYEMDPGSYKFSVTIGNMYIVEFEFTVE
ncbi:MAG: hypothetical protein E7627_04730 [Ruminococcaceae bacterium]|nr:hypothetical protein [Oscillospiraceae bacterium]